MIEIYDYISLRGIQHLYFHLEISIHVVLLLKTRIKFRIVEVIHDNLDVHRDVLTPQWFRPARSACA